MLQADEKAATIARQILKEKHGRYRQLEYSDLGIV
jgi:hypothetical protein